MLIGLWAWLSRRGHLLSFTLFSFGLFLSTGAAALCLWFGCVLGCSG